MNEETEKKKDIKAKINRIDLGNQKHVDIKKGIFRLVRKFWKSYDKKNKKIATFRTFF